MSLMEKVNIDLLGPLLIVFAFLRLQKYHCFPLQLLSGTRAYISNALFNKNHLRMQTRTDNQKDAHLPDKIMKEYDLSRMELDSSVRKSRIFAGVLLYNVYENIILLGLSSFAVHTFSTIFHCISPKSIYSIWGNILVAFSVVIPFRALIRIVAMAGFEAFESRLALVVAAICFFASASALLLLTPLDILGLPLDDVLNATAKHCNALLNQLSSTAWQPSASVMVIFVKLTISMLVAMTALGMVIPAMRFSQTFNRMIFGADHELATEKRLIILDYISPLFVALIMTANVSRFGSDGHLLALQIVQVLVMIVMRLKCMKIYIQHYLYGIEKLFIESGAKSEDEILTVQEKVDARFKVIPAAAVQFICGPLVILGLTMLMHKAAPAGTGICVDLRSVMGMDTVEMISASQALLSYDATSAAYAMINGGEPSLMNGLYLFLMSAGEGGVSPSRDLRAFLVRLTSTLHLLPVGAFVTLARAAICVHSMLWFVIYSSAILYWYLNPVTLRNASDGFENMIQVRVKNHLE